MRAIGRKKTSVAPKFWKILLFLSDNHDNFESPPLCQLAPTLCSTNIPPYTIIENPEFFQSHSPSLRGQRSKTTHRRKKFKHNPKTENLCLHFKVWMVFLRELYARTGDVWKTLNLRLFWPRHIHSLWEKFDSFYSYSVEKNNSIPSPIELHVLMYFFVCVHSTVRGELAAKQRTAEK